MHRLQIHFPVPEWRKKVSTILWDNFKSGVSSGRDEEIDLDCYDLLFVYVPTGLFAPSSILSKPGQLERIQRNRVLPQEAQFIRVTRTKSRSIRRASNTVYLLSTPSMGDSSGSMLIS